MAAESTPRSDDGSATGAADTGALDACLLLFRADTELRRRFDAVLSDVHGLGVTDFTVLANLADVPGRQLRRVDLASRLGLTASAVTRLLAPLEQVGLVERRSNPDDARVALAVLTDAGVARVAEARDTAGRRAAELLEAQLTRDDIVVLGRLLARLVPAASH